MTNHPWEKSLNWTKAIMGSKLTKQVAWVAITETIPKSLEWPSSACMLTDSQIKHVHVPMRRCAVHLLGVQACMPSATVCGSQELLEPD